MILQVLADALELVANLDARLLQHLALTDPGKFEDLRAADGAGRQQHLAARLDETLLATDRVAHARGALVVERDGFDLGVRDDAQVGAPGSILEIGDRRRAAPAIADGGLVVARTLLRGAVEVVRRGDARLDTGRDERGAQRIVDVHVRDREGAAGAVQLAFAALLALCLLEVRQHVREGPADIAELAPHVVVARLTAYVEQPVDRARAAEDASARPGDIAAAEMRLGACRVLPGDVGIVHRAEIAAGNVDPGVGVFAAGLQQRDRHARLLAQPVGEHAARRSGSHDDVVVAAFILPNWHFASRSSCVVRACLLLATCCRECTPNAGKIDSSGSVTD